MTKKIVPVNAEEQLPATPAVPSFMQQVEDTGVMDLSQFITPPRIKIVQKQASSEFLSAFDPGDVIIVPQRQLLSPVMKLENGRSSGEGTPFHFVPLFFFPEWCLWNPIELKGTLPAIRERTTDPNNPMVARSRNPQLWHQPCPESPDPKNCCRYVEHLNFVVLLLGDTELSQIPIVLSFSRAEHKAGSSFAALIKMRRAPIFGCQFEARTVARGNAKGEWFGFDVYNPAADSGVQPFVQNEEQFAQYKLLYEELRDAHQRSIIKVDYDDEAEDVASTPNEF